jgi:hypothetical protein
MRDLVTVIIPTTCESHREEVLWRAIGSLKSQEAAPPQVLIIVNGKRVHAPAYETLIRQPELRVQYRENGNVSEARYFGRTLVDTPFFAFLDDDDIFLPNALQIRLEAMAPHCDVVVTNGQFYDEPVFVDVAEIRKNPLRALARRCWLASCGGLYRTRTIGPEFFNHAMRWNEVTVLAFDLLLAGKCFEFVDDLTWRTFRTENSAYAQTSPERAEQELALLRELVHRAPKQVRRVFRQKLVDQLHAISDSFLTCGDLDKAFQYHFACLKNHGFRYCLYTCLLLYAALERRRTGTVRAPLQSQNDLPGRAGWKRRS